MLKLYKGFDIKHVTRTKGINRKEGKSEFKEMIIARFDTPKTFFYLDLPYYTKEHLYDREDADAFTKHEELAAALKNFKG